MAVEAKELGHYAANDATALVSPDGNKLAIQFSMDGDQTIAFSLDIEIARKLMHSMAVIASASLSDPTAKGDAGFVRMTPIVSVSANPTDDLGKVAMCLFDENQVPHYFVVPCQTSELLRRHLQAAEMSSSQGVVAGNA